MKPNDVFKLDMTAARLAGDAEERLTKPTPDKTLEELAREFAAEWYPSAQDEAARMFLVEPLVKFAALATAAQQREVENIQKAGDALADIVESLSKQLRTEREKYKELFMKAQDLVEELKRVTTTN